MCVYVFCIYVRGGCVSVCNMLFKQHDHIYYFLLPDCFEDHHVLPTLWSVRLGRSGPGWGVSPLHKDQVCFLLWHLLVLLGLFSVPSPHAHCLREPFELLRLTSVLFLHFPAGVTGPGRWADALSWTQGRGRTLTAAVMSLFLPFSSWMGAGRELQDDGN